MPGITMIGEKRRARYTPTALPAEARALSRMLSLLKSSHSSSAALMGALSQMPSSSQCQEIQKNLQESLDRLETLNLPVKQTSDRMSIVSELAIRTAFENSNLGKEDSHRQRGSGEEEDSDVDSISPRRDTRSMKTSAAALVSDSSTAGTESESEAMDDVNVSLKIKQFWGSLLEAVNLQVTSRTTSVWGKKKIYEVYQLTAPSSLDDSIDDIRKAVEREFRTVFHGGGEDNSGCRTYAVSLESNSLYIQMNIGACYDYCDERNRSVSGEKKKKADYEFVAKIDAGSPLIALTASRAPSRSRLTKFVLTALDAALSKNASGTTTKDMFPKRVGDWSGAEPQELLNNARAAQTGVAVGRFASYAAEPVVDPLTELHMASTSSLLDRSAEQKRLKIGAQHGRSVAQLSKSVPAPAALVATNKSGMLVDHSASAKIGRKRARDGQLGREGDCPQLQRLCWKWTGETSAASACWMDDGEPSEDLPKTKFKCGVVMQGTNIVEGLRAMMDAGLAVAPLPDFVRDAPTLGTSTITVENGSFVSSDSFAAV